MLSLLITLSFANAQTAPAPAATAATPLARVVVLGASVSDGFGLDGDVGVRTTFADVVDAAMLVEHQPVQVRADPLMFLDVDASARRLVEDAKVTKPTLVVAIDYLFWFGYGEAASDDARLAKLERGLKSLEGFECPLLVGDFADMSLALEVDPQTVMVALAPQQVPSPASLERLNARLTQWAAERPNVVIAPCADVMKRLRADEEVRARGNIWHKGSLEFLLQKDRLHTTLEGSIAMWICAADRLVKLRPEIPSSAFEWRSREIYKRVYGVKEPARKRQVEQRIEELKKANPVVPTPVDTGAPKSKPRGG
ncbi:MAG: hypothetical protein ACKVWV_08275 [Planctomycetota bacterium]